MDCQSTGRNQRPKGFKATQALQLTLILAVCVWLLYQIKHSHNKEKDYGGNVQSKLSGEHGVVILGRKANAGLSIDSNDVNHEAEGKLKDGGGGDDELDGNAQEESFHKGNDFVSGNLVTEVGKKVGKEPETQPKVSLMSKDNNSDVEKRKIDKSEGLYKDTTPTAKYPHKGDLDAKGNEKDVERKISPNEKGDSNNTKAQVNHDKLGNDRDPERKGEGEAVDFNKENDEDEDHTAESEQGIAMLPIEMKNDTDLGRSEMEDEVNGFLDENGVPPDNDDLLESMLTYSRDD